MKSQRNYGICAKCGEAKDENQQYVHDHCKYPHKKGGFHFCAVCGKKWDESSVSIRDYVCLLDLAVLNRGAK